KADVTGLLNRWSHVTAVVKGISDIELYLNGVNVGGYSTGDSSSPMVSNSPGGHSTSAYFLSNGFTYKSNGIIDDIRLWNRSLSQEEIRQTMCVILKGNESGLIGYWDFNETSGNTVYDKSPNKFNGQFVGNPQRVFSGAAIGDVSTYSYSTSWSGTTVSHQDNDYKVDVKNINGVVSGVQIYEVKNVPSQTSGLDLNNTNEPYFGVFLVSQDANIHFDADYYFQGNGSCQILLRDDNTNSIWVEADNPVVQKSERAEIVAGFGVRPDFDLGKDTVLCDQPSYEISTGITDPQLTFQWNTGQSTSSILVSQSGSYSVNVSGICGVIRDSIKVDFREAAKPISLGDDLILCDQASYELSTGLIDPKFTFQWSTGQNTSAISVSQSGLYKVLVFGYCDVVSDSILLSFEEKPKVTLEEDKIVCDQPSHSISTNILNPQYTFQWNTGQTTPSIVVSETQLYSVKVFGYCGMAEDSVLISFKETPKFVLGDDKILCDNTAAVISTGITNDEFTFQWSTGESTSSISVSETGLYSVTVTGYCGAFEDNVTITFDEKPIPFSLGDDSEICDFDSKILQPVMDINGLTFLWQDGSTNPIFNVESYGDFWVTVKNSCGQESDTIRFTKKNYVFNELPNVITPNGDSKNDYFIVDNEIAGLVSLQVFNRWGNEVYHSSAYQNQWNGEDLSPGVYYVVLEGPCIEKSKGLVSIIK
ncbi:MAG TPA: gliding motility-associated C-terminal domain-containing protein, partial [Chryseolinea sp.]|nr:gliding motility-associated C-terminal domain-containing protein [Chryseolinea sp.]